MVANERKAEEPSPRTAEEPSPRTAEEPSPRTAEEHSRESHSHGGRLHSTAHNANVCMHRLAHEAEAELAAVKVQAVLRGKKIRKAVAHAHVVSSTKKAFKRLRPHKGHFFHGGFPGAPVHSSVEHALSCMPEDASCYERMRDQCLNFMLTHQHFFLALAATFLVIFVIDICVLIFVGWGAIFGIGIIGFNPDCDLKNYPAENVTFEGNAQYPPQVNGQYVAEYCNLNQRIFNYCIKVIVLIMTYINILPLPWRIAITVDAWEEVLGVSSRETGVGLDFYGRETESMWFHIPSAKRASIALLEMFASLFQVLNCIFCLYYWPYLQTQTWPGSFLINFPVAISISCAIAAGIKLGKEEKKLVREQPERFPEPISAHLMAAFRKWKAGKSGKPLFATLKEALDEIKADAEEKGHPKAVMLLEIGAIKSSPHSSV